MTLVVQKAFHLAAAEAFVQAQGSAMQRAWWGAAFGHGPVEVLLFELMPFQQESGEWGGALGPAGDVNLPASKGATMFALRLISGLALGEDVFELGPRTLDALAKCCDESGRFAWRDGHLEGAELLAFAAYLDRMGAKGEAYELAMAQAIATANGHQGEAWWSLGWGPLALGRHPEFAPWVARIELGLAEALSAGLEQEHPGLEPDVLGGKSACLAAWQAALAQLGRPHHHPLRSQITRLLVAQQESGGALNPHPGSDRMWATLWGAQAILAV